MNSATTVASVVCSRLPLDGKPPVLLVGGPSLSVLRLVAAIWVNHANEQRRALTGSQSDRTHEHGIGCETTRRFWTSEICRSHPHWSGRLTGVSLTTETTMPTGEVPRARAASGYSGLLAGAAAYGIWGLFPLYFRELRGISAWEIAGIRVLATALVTWVVLACRRDFAWIRTALLPGVRLRLVLAGFAIATNWLIYVWAVANGHVVDAAIGYYINPLVTVAVGVVVLHERLTRLQKVALGFGATSVGVLSFAYGKVPWIALGLAFSFAAYGYLKKTTGLQPMQSLAAETTALTPFALVGLALIARLDRIDALHSPAKAQLFLLATGVVTAIPLVLFGMAARKIPLAQIGLLQYIAPTMVLLCGVALLSEHISGERWVGVLLVWVALMLLAIDAFSSRQSTANVGRTERTVAEA